MMRYKLGYLAITLIVLSSAESGDDYLAYNRYSCGNRTLHFARAYNIANAGEVAGKKRRHFIDMTHPLSGSYSSYSIPSSPNTGNLIEDFRLNVEQLREMLPYPEVTPIPTMIHNESVQEIPDDEKERKNQEEENSCHPGDE